MMVDCKRPLAGAALCAGLGAATAFADASALEKFAGAKEAIMSYYVENARENNCDAGNMTDIGGANVVSESGDQAVVKVGYTFSATSGAGGTGCTGESLRESTLTKSGSGWSVSGMAGGTP